MRDFGTLPTTIRTAMAPIPQRREVFILFPKAYVTVRKIGGANGIHLSASRNDNKGS